MFCVQAALRQIVRTTAEAPFFRPVRNGNKKYIFILTRNFYCLMLQKILHFSENNSNLSHYCVNLQRIPFSLFFCYCATNCNLKFYKNPGSERQPNLTHPIKLPIQVSETILKAFTNIFRC